MLLLRCAAAAAAAAERDDPALRSILPSTYDVILSSGLQVVVLPILFPATTDSRWYASLAGGRVYRFSPAYLNSSAGELAMVHGSDERISISHLMDGIRFYTRLLRLAA